MKALTVWQPWADLIALGLKKYEFRGWPLPASAIGVDVAIHAGARKMDLSDLRKLRYDLAASKPTGIDPSARDLVETWLQLVAAKQQPLWLSSVVAIVQFGPPIRNAELAKALGVDRVNDSDRNEHTNWGWPITEVRALTPPVPACGAQGLWTWHGGSDQ